MKMIFAIVNNDDANDVMKALNEERISVTKLASTGGFLMKGINLMEINKKSNSTHYAEYIWNKSDFLSFPSGENSIIILGYKVKLTRTEYDILKLVWESNGYVTSERIIEKCLAHKDVTRGDVAIHIHNLNKRIEGITARKLVVGVRRKGYKIVDNI